MQIYSTQIIAGSIYVKRQIQKKQLEFDQQCTAVLNRLLRVGGSKKNMVMVMA